MEREGGGGEWGTLSILTVVPSLFLEVDHFSLILDSLTVSLTDDIPPSLLSLYTNL